MIANELIAFLRENITSVEELEILLLMSSERSSAWTAKSINVSIQSSVRSIEARLQSLERRGFVRQEEKGWFSYCPRDETISTRTEELLAAYSSRRVQVIEALYSAETGNLKQFANAFSWKKKNG
jgi:predicted DNA-binding transcriptional regulator